MKFLTFKVVTENTIEIEQAATEICKKHSLAVRTAVEKVRVYCKDYHALEDISQNVSKLSDYAWDTARDKRKLLDDFIALRRWFLWVLFTELALGACFLIKGLTR